jgi:hypothetical protein
MRLFDRRHRWGEPVRNGVYLSRTCLSCGRRDVTETMIPDLVVSELLRAMVTPNPWRGFLREWSA